MTEMVDEVARAQAGDRAAFGRLVERFEGMAVVQAPGWLRDPDSARDASQEAFIDAEGHRTVDAPGRVRQPSPLPRTYKVKCGPKGSEDFVFDRQGNLISVDYRRARARRHGRRRVRQRVRRRVRGGCARRRRRAFVIPNPWDAGTYGARSSTVGK
jgi:hypothetical protein